MRRLILFAATGLLFLAPAAAHAQAYGDPASLVNYWYRTYLGRPAGPASGSWVALLQQGNAPDAVLSGILASDEYYKRAGYTPQGYVGLLFRDVVRRQPSASEMRYWVQRMYTEDRQSIADEILGQNPGDWVGAGSATVAPAYPPPVVEPVEPFNPGVIISPSIDFFPHQDWERDHHDDWDHHHDIHEYRRPAPIQIHRGDDHRRDDHR